MTVKHTLSVIGIMVLLVVLGGVGILMWTLYAALPVVQGQLSLPSLSAPVTVIRDHAGVPHIFATTPADAMRALGFVNAQAGRFQMELSRRQASGRLAELYGEASLESDRLMRTLGLIQVVEREFALLSAADQALFAAFAEGVNSATEQYGAGRALELRLLGVHPEPWTPIDSLVIVKGISLFSAFQAQQEAFMAALLREVGEAALLHYLPPSPEDGVPPLVDTGMHAGNNNGEPWPASLLRAASRQFFLEAALLTVKEPTRSGRFVDIPAWLFGSGHDRAGEVLFSPGPQGRGSNNWVVHGSRTATGAPLLASDPHGPLPFSGPLTAHLAAPGLEVIGVGALPGAPFFTHGHNARVAWGVTSTGVDAADLFLEELREGDPPQVHTAAGWEPLSVRREEIRVRGRAEPVVQLVRRSSHGPLVSDVLPALLQQLGKDPAASGGAHAAAMAWTGFTPSSPSWIFALLRAHDWLSFREALRGYAGPDVNFVYADVEDHIGYQLAARIPLREGPPPVTPSPGWERGHEWIGEVPFDALPYLFDPPEGFIATANARITGPHYPYHLATRWLDIPLRVQRIYATLAAKSKLTMEDCMQLQLDIFQSEMREVVDWAQSVPSTDPEVQWFQHALEGWDYRADTASLAQALAEAFRLELAHAVFRPKLSPALFKMYEQEWGSVEFLALQQAMTDAQATFFGPDPTEARKARAAMVEQAIHHALARLETALGADRRQWSWGRLHTVTFVHPFALAPGALGRLWGWLLNVGPFPAPGSAFTVNAGYWDRTEPFAMRGGPVYRQIVDLGDLTRSRYAPMPPGQSGPWLSAHYGDLAQPWLTGQYSSMGWTRTQIEAEAESTLTLTP